MAEIKYIKQYAYDDFYIIGYAQNDGTHLNCVRERMVQELPKTAQEWLKGKMPEMHFNEDVGKDEIVWQ